MIHLKKLRKIKSDIIEDSRYSTLVSVVCETGTCEAYEPPKSPSALNWVFFESRSAHSRRLTSAFLVVRAETIRSEFLALF